MNLSWNLRPGRQGQAAVQYGRIRGWRDTHGLEARLLLELVAAGNHRPHHQSAEGDDHSRRRGHSQAAGPDLPQPPQARSDKVNKELKRTCLL